MDARIASAAMALLVALSCGLVSESAQAQTRRPAGRSQHSVRSQFFIVSAPTPQLAEEICQAAETFRRELAIEWLGRELPPWREPCPIVAHVSPQLGAGGVTSFMFDRGQPFGWTMEIQGSRERVLDSVLPHEITHTIFATHFGRPLPRWADEGACTTVESDVEKRKQQDFLIKFLQTDRGIPFNQMFAMREYPPDILPLYSQGFSLARFLIQQGGKPKFVEYVGAGMRTNNWTAATNQFYGFRSLSELQVTWLDWVRQGSPDLRADEALVQNEPIQPQDLAAAEATAASPVSLPQSAGLPAVPSQAASGSHVAASPAGPVTQMDSLARRQQIRASGTPQDGWQEVSQQNLRGLARDRQFSPPAQPSSFSADQFAAAAQRDSSSVSRPVSEGWYAKRRDQAQTILHSSPEAAPSVPQNQSFSIPAPPTREVAPQEGSAPRGSFSPSPAAAPIGDRRVLLEWSRSGTSAAPAPRTAASDVALYGDGPVRR